MSSSGIVDAILEECQVPLEKRAQLLRKVGELARQGKPVPEMVMSIKKNGLLANNDGQIEKFKNLIKLKGATVD